jgi:hypothetical protein
MDRREAQFCRDEAERLLKLARQAVEPEVKQHLLDMAEQWVKRAAAKANFRESA